MAPENRNHAIKSLTMQFYLAEQQASVKDTFSTLDWRMFSIAIDNGVARLPLGPVLGMREAQPLKQALQEALAKGLPLVLEAHLIERMSTACAQVLVAFAAAKEQASLPPRLSRPSAAFLAAFGTLGLDPIIRTWTVEE